MPLVLLALLAALVLAAPARADPQQISVAGWREQALPCTSDTLIPIVPSGTHFVSAYVRCDAIATVQGLSNAPPGFPTRWLGIDAAGHITSGQPTVSLSGVVADPTATAGPSAILGNSNTVMRSDSAPAIQLGSASQFGLMRCDNTTVTCPGGVLSSSSGSGGLSGLISGQLPVANSATTANSSVPYGTTGNSTLVATDSGGHISNTLIASFPATSLSGTALPTSVVTSWLRTPVDWVNPKNYGAVCDGGSHPLFGFYGSLSAAQAVYPFITSLTQQIDYAALKLASNTALGVDGSEHGTSTTLNRPIYLPAGTCNLGSDTWTIRNADGIQIQGAGASATTLTGSSIVLQFDGLWYSRLSDINVITTSSSAGVALDIDGNVPGHPYSTRSVQGNQFNGLHVDGGGSTYSVAMCRQGVSNGQCSENTWNNFHGLNASFAVYYQTGYNALDNVLLGGDMQSFTGNGVYLNAGSIKIYGMSVESTYGYSSVRQGDCDFTFNAGGTNDTIVIDGVRSEDMCIVNGGSSQPLGIRGISQALAVQPWTATTHFSLDAITSQTGADSKPHIYAVTTAGTTGGSPPTWPSSGTVTDGSVTWTEITYNAITGYGCVDDATLRGVDGTASVYTINCAINGGNVHKLAGTGIDFSTNFFVDSNGNNQVEACVVNATCFYYNPLGSTVALASGLTLPANATGVLGYQLNLQGTFGTGVYFGSPYFAESFTVATLPTCNSSWKGSEIFVSDATNPGGGNPIVAGSGAGVKGFCNGTNWVSELPSVSGDVAKSAGTTGSPQTFTGVNKFGTVSGAARVVSAGSTDTLLATDCGEEVIYNNAAYTVTIPASIVPASGTLCVIRIRTNTANKVSVNGSAVTAASLVSADSFTGTQAVTGSAISLDLTTVGGTATAYLDGHGS